MTAFYMAIGSSHTKLVTSTSFFHKDDTDEFKYYEVDKNDSIIEKLKNGKFAFDGKMISLESDEGWNDFFNGVMYYKHNGTNFYLTDNEEGLYLVKGSD